MDEILRDLSDAAPIPTRHGQREAPTGPPAALATAELVYVRKGGQLQPLAQPYSGPYKVLEKGPKYFRLDIGGRSTVEGERYFWGKSELGYRSIYSTYSK